MLTGHFLFSLSPPLFYFPFSYENKNYFCAKTSSPILWVAEYKFADYIDGSVVAVCLTEATDNWIIGFYMMIIFIFFMLPLFILIVLYGIIAKNLITNKGPMMRIRPIKPEFSLKARKQVVLMLGAVVVAFFLCLLPFRLLTLYIIWSEEQTLHDLGVEYYYSILYFCRIMLYLNSAINPILYNLMSTKFRKGFYKVVVSSWTGLSCCCHCGTGRKRLGTNVVATTTTTSSNTNTATNTSSSILSRSSNRRSSDEATQRCRVPIQLPMPYGQDCEMVVMLHPINTDATVKEVLAASNQHTHYHHQPSHRFVSGGGKQSHNRPLRHQHVPIPHLVSKRSPQTTSFAEEAATS